MRQSKSNHSILQKRYRDEESPEEEQLRVEEDPKNVAEASGNVSMEPPQIERRGNKRRVVNSTIPKDF
jgi:hypothetical protein